MKRLNNHRVGRSIEVLPAGNDFHRGIHLFLPLATIVLPVGRERIVVRQNRGDMAGGGLGSLQAFDGLNPRFDGRPWIVPGKNGNRSSSGSGTVPGTGQVTR